MLIFFLTRGFMKIYFRSRKMKKRCNNSKKMLKAFGVNRSKKLKARLEDLRASTFLSDISHLPPARLHQLSQDKDEQFTVDLDQPYRLLFIVANKPIPRKKDGGIDLKKVNEIEIIKILDPH